MTRLLPFLLIVLTGCFGEPEDISAEAEAANAPEVPREEWTSAPAGCEDAPTDSELVRTEGEPSLGGLVDGEGHLLCIDDLALLLREREARVLSDDWDEADPSPQPSRDPLKREDPAPGPDGPCPAPSGAQGMDLDD